MDCRSEQTLQSAIMLHPLHQLAQSSNFKDLLHPLADPYPTVPSHHCGYRKAHRLLTARICDLRCRYNAHRLQIWIIFVRKRLSRSFLHLCLVGVEGGLVNCHFGWSKSWCSNEFESSVSDQFSGEPEERLFEVVVGFG